MKWDLELLTFVVAVLALIANFGLFWVNLRAANAAKHNAETATKEFLLNRRPLIATTWRVRRATREHVLLVVTVREVAGVPTELRRAETEVEPVGGGPLQRRTQDFTDAVLSGTEFTRDVGVGVDLRGFEVPGFDRMATINVKLTLSAVGVDDPQEWRVDSFLEEDDGEFKVMNQPPRPHRIQPTKKGFFQRCREACQRWAEWNERFRGPGA